MARCGVGRCKCPAFKPQKWNDSKCHCCFHWADQHISLGGYSAIPHEAKISEATSTFHLHQCNFQPLIAKLKLAHFEGTRRWLFDEIRTWIRSGTQRLFWLEGAAGTGKSVVTAKLMDMVGVKEHIVAWHFCRHDNAVQNSVRAIIESWAAMLSEHVNGFVLTADAKRKALSSLAVNDMFQLLIAEPLQTVPAPSSRVLLLILDALDELPRDSLVPVLDLIANMFDSLPSFVRLFVTSRAETEIKTRLRSFQPIEIKVDELRNRADVRAYLVHVARVHFKMELSSADLEASLEGQFKLEPGALKDKLSVIEHAIQLSRSVYNDVVEPMKRDPIFRNTCAIKDKLNTNMLQTGDTLEVLYEDAKEARDKMLGVFASEWMEFSRIDGGRTVLSKPKEGKAAEWVDNVIDPGLKGRESALRKITNDYGGDARRMKDLVRFTVECEDCHRMLPALHRMQGDENFEVIMLRNKYAAPTLLGYCDFNLSVRVHLASGQSHIAEVQVNLKDMVKAKELAHVHYEKVRSEIPHICNAVGIVEQRMKSQFETTLLKMLQRSALDAAVGQLEARTAGLFLYATLLARELQMEPGLRDFSKLRQLPSGLSEIYKVNFDRMVEKNRAGWPKFKRVVSVIVVAREPVPKGVVQQIMGSEFDAIAESLSVLFPSRDGRFEVMHKSVVDWLREPGHAYSLTEKDAATAHNELAPVLLSLSREYGRSHILDMNYSVRSNEVSFALRQAANHLCAAGLFQEMHQMVTNFEWLLARVATGSCSALILDIENVNKIKFDGLTRLVASALRLALEPLNEDWKRLAGQLVGRLLGHIAKDDVYALLREVCQWRGPSNGWWCHVLPNMETAGGSLISSFVHPASVTCVQWSSDGKLVCTGSSSLVRVWSLESGECLQTFTGHSFDVNAVAWNSDNKHICSGSGDETVKIWSLESGECLQTFEGHSFDVTSVAWSSDNKHIASGSKDQTAKVWSLETGECVQTFTGHADAVCSLAWDNNNNHICSASHDQTIKVWSMENDECLQTFEGHSNTVTSIAWSSDYKHICSGSADETVKIWSLSSGECLQTFEGHFNEVNSVAWSSDNKRICSGDSDGKVKAWSVESGECLQTFEGHTFDVNSVSWRSGSDHICSGSRDATAKVWCVENDALVPAVDGHQHTVTSVSWDNDKKQLCSGSGDKTAKLWSLETGECLQTFSGHTDVVTSIAWRGDGKRICSGSRDSTVKVWSVENGECVQTFKAHTSDVTSVAWSGDERYICSGSKDALVMVWFVETGECVQTLRHTADVTSVAWSSDSKHICSGSTDKTVKVWLMGDSEYVQTFRGHSADVISVAWSNDGKRICSGSKDKTVKVWSVANGECLRTFEGHTFWVTSVGWSIDNKHVYGGSYDSVVKVWSVESGKLTADNQPSDASFLQSCWGLGKEDGNEPIAYETGMCFLLCPSNNKRAFAGSGKDETKIHALRALGGSKCTIGDLDFLEQMRSKVCPRKMLKEENKVAEQMVLSSESLHCSKCERVTNFRCLRCAKEFCETCSSVVQGKHLCWAAVD